MRSAALIKRPSLGAFAKSSVVRLVAQSIQFEAAPSGGGDVAATSSVVLGSVTASATAAVHVAGTSSATLGAVASSATGAVRIAGAGAQTLAAFTGTATATVRNGAASSQTIGAVAGSAAASVIVEGVSGVVLGTITGTGAFTVGGGTINAAASVQIGSVTGCATARNAGFLTIPVRVIPPPPPTPHGPRDHRRRAMQKAWDAWNETYR